MPAAFTWLRAQHTCQDDKAKPKTRPKEGEKKMNTVKKLMALIGWLSVLCAIPAMAQTSSRVTFDAPSAFYAGNMKMPAGSYTVTVPNADDNFLLIEDADGSHSVFVEFAVTSSDTPHAQSDVTFNKYGKDEFLSEVWVEGEDSGMQVLPSKAEQDAAKAVVAEKQSPSDNNTGEAQ
jgi:hypothetical protein